MTRFRQIYKQLKINKISHFTNIGKESFFFFETKNKDEKSLVSKSQVTDLAEMTNVSF